MQESSWPACSINNSSRILLGCAQPVPRRVPALLHFKHLFRIAFSGLSVWDPAGKGVIFMSGDEWGK